MSLRFVSAFPHNDRIVASCRVPDHLKVDDAESAKRIRNGELREYSHIKDDTKCPKRAKTGADDDLNDRSLCPWFQELHHDERRVPPTLPYVRCKCMKCLGKDFMSSCERVYYKVRVLRRSEKCGPDGEYTYEYDWEYIPVACVCANAKSYVIGYQ